MGIFGYGNRREYPDTLSLFDPEFGVADNDHTSVLKAKAAIGLAFSMLSGVKHIPAAFF